MRCCSRLSGRCRSIGSCPEPSPSPQPSAPQPTPSDRVLKPLGRQLAGPKSSTNLTSLDLPFAHPAFRTLRHGAPSPLPSREGRRPALVCLRLAPVRAPPAFARASPRPPATGQARRPPAQRPSRRAPPAPGHLAQRAGPASGRAWGWAGAGARGGDGPGRRGRGRGRSRVRGGGERGFEVGGIADDD